MISTHVLDTSKGNPAAGIEVKLQKVKGPAKSLILLDSPTWEDVESGITDVDGRYSFNCEKVAGIYRLTFEIEKYLKAETKDFFFLQAPVVFKIENINRKYHVPLLLNPFGYSTYRGS